MRYFYRYFNVNKLVRLRLSNKESDANKKLLNKFFNDRIKALRYIFSLRPYCLDFFSSLMVLGRGELPVEYLMEMLIKSRCGLNIPDGNFFRDIPQQVFDKNIEVLTNYYNIESYTAYKYCHNNTKGFDISSILPGTVFFMVKENILDFFIQGTDISELVNIQTNPSEFITLAYDIADDFLPDAINLLMDMERKMFVEAKILEKILWQDLGSYKFCTMEDLKISLQSSTPELSIEELSIERICSGVIWLLLNGFLYFKPKS